MGLEVGSIEHNTWKSAVQMEAGGHQYLEKFCCYSGASSTLTRDALPHGEVKGKTVKSAKMFFGFFADWRKGFETYAQANTKEVSSPIQTTVYDFFSGKVSF